MDNSKPVVQIFDASKTAIHDGEPLTLSWEVIHADSIEIDVLGKVSAQGTKTLRLPKLQHRPNVNIVLRAYNGAQITEKNILIKNKSFQGGNAIPETKLQAITTPNKKAETKAERSERDEQAEREERKHKEEREYRKQLEEADIDDDAPATHKTISTFSRKSASLVDDSQPKERRNDIYIYFIVFIIMILIAMLAFVVYQLNGLKN